MLSLTATGKVEGGGMSAAGTAATYTIVNYGRVLGRTDAIDLQGAGDVVNLGVVASAKTSSGQHGVYLGEGGEVSNGTSTEKSATISGYGSAVRILGEAGTVVNFGTIASTDTAAAHPGVQLGAGGDVTNYGLIEGGQGLGVAGGPGTVINAGTITAALSETGGFGIDLADGGLIINRNGAVIVGGRNVATGALGGDGILQSGGSLANAGAISGGQGGGAYAYNVSAGPGGAGIAQTGGIASNTGAITGGAGGGGGVGVGTGGLGGAGATIAAGTLISTGAIVGGVGGSGGANAQGSGGLTTQPPGAGGTGVWLSYGSLANAGAIVGGKGGDGGYYYVAGAVGGAGVTLSGGALTNTGTVLGGRGGAGGAGYDGHPGGANGAAGDSVSFSGAGLIFNGSPQSGVALLEGGIGVYGGTGGAGTVVNYGTIDGTSGAAVEFQSPTDRLVAEAGSTFIGSVIGGGGTLELARAAGTITGLGGSGTVSGAEALRFGAFNGFDLDSGGNWTLAGGASLAAGQSLTIASGATATVVGGKGAVLAGADGAATVTNFGTIDGTGGASVVFKDDLDRLIAGIGSVFNGSVSGGGGTLELAGGTGTITNLEGAGSVAGAEAISFSGFKHFHLDAGGTWALAGGRLAAGESFRIDAGASATVLGGDALALGGGELAVVGALDLGGEVGAKRASLVVDGADTVSGAGTVDLGAAGFIGAGDSTASLTNQATIAGQGLIGGKLTVTNAPHAVIEASTGRLEIGLGAHTLINAGLVEADGAGSLLLHVTTLANTGGSVKVYTTFELSGSTITGGAVSVAAGALLYGGSGSAIAGATVTNAGTIKATKGPLSIVGAVSNSGILEADAGNLDIFGAVTGTGAARISGGGALWVYGALGETVTFAGAGPGTLILGDSAAFTGTVAGLSRTGANSIELKDVVYNAADTVAYSTRTGALIVYDASHAVLATIKLKDSYAGSTFELVNRGFNGTAIIDPKVAAFAASMAGLGAGGGSASGSATISTQLQPVLATPHIA